MTPIIQFCTSVGALILASASLFGWGTSVRRLARMANGTWPVTIGLGLSAVLLIGGIANVARIAFASTLLGVTIVGLLFTIFHFMKSKVFGPNFFHPNWAWITWIEAGLVTAFIVIAVGFTITTQLPPDVFNFQDDLQKYFAHPVRQLETGTLYGSPLSALGSQSLGGIAFLHSFVLSIAPIEFINGVDAVFGLLLLLCLGAVAGWRRMTFLPGALIAPLLIATINPQYVNVSALFLGAALIATAVLLTLNEREEYSSSAFAIGLVYSGLVALKPIFTLFVMLHLPFAAIALSIIHGSARVGVLWALRTAAFAALALSPWVILHLPHYLNVSALDTFAVPSGQQERINLFSSHRLSYGATILNYTILIGLALLTAFWSLIGLLQGGANSCARRLLNLLAAATTVTLAYAIFMLLSPVLDGYESSLRYSIPFLLGVVPMITVLSMRKLSFGPSWLGIGVTLAVYAATVISFLPSFFERTRQSIKYHSILAFSNLSQTPEYIEYNRAALSAASAQAVRKLQYLIPPGESFIAWINQPYHFDFRRNPIIDVEPAGLATNWARLPKSVRYVIWEYQGFGVPTPQDYVYGARASGWHERFISMRALAFTQSLNAELKTAKVIYTDNQFVVAQFSQR
jgi:hypothetical protein